jgi:hypothetical protein
LAALLSLAGGACDRADEPQKPKAAGATLVGGPEDPVGIGALATAADYQMSVEGVQDCTLPPPFSAPKGRQKVAVEVVLEGRTSREVPVNPFYAMLEAETGASYEATLAGCKPVLRAQRIVLGDKARGLVTFEIPASARGLRLVYSPVVIGGGREELKFDLGR